MDLSTHTDALSCDLVRDDMDGIRSLKGELKDLIQSIERKIACGLLPSVDRSVLAIRIMAMEMYLDEILTPDWERLATAVGTNEGIPKYTSCCLGDARQLLRVATNPATHEAMGVPL
jgi:hypothetical protein